MSGGVAAILTAAAAYACTALATIETSAPAGVVGDNIAITGTAFAAGMGTNPVVLHWDSPTGPELASAMPDARGSFSAAFKVPEAKPGHHLIVAIQKNPKGQDQFGTPARGSFEVLSPTGVPAPVRSNPAAAPSGSDSGLAAIALMSGLGLLGVVLFGAGLGTLARARRRTAPVPVRAPRD